MEQTELWSSDQTSLSVAGRVRESASVENVRDLLMHGVQCGLSISGLLKKSGQKFSCWKMSQGYSAQTEAKTSHSSQPRYKNMGMSLRGELLTLRVRESLRDADVGSALHHVLERKVASKFYLSRKACRGILRRVADRGTQIPERLRTALERVVENEK